jgi:hypothetical protein
MILIKIPVSVLTIFLVIGLLLINADAQARRYDNRSDEQKAADKEEYIKSSELKIGADCQPHETMLRMRLKTFNANDLREFWRGQTYAVERTYQNFIRRERERLIESDADRRIAEIEAQRDEAMLRQRGLEPRNSARFDATIERIDRSMARRYGERAERKYEWYLKCGAYAYEQSRR